MSSRAQPASAHDRYVGQVVSWAGHDGETLTGVVQGYNPEIAKFIVKTDEGMKAVAPHSIDQLEAG